jgi:hypothetical protein
MEPKQHCVLFAGLLVGCTWSANVEAQTQAPSEPAAVRGENTGQPAGPFRGAPTAPDDVSSTKKAASGVRTCARESEGEIVVCGRSGDERFRLKPLPDKYQHKSFLGQTLDIPIAPGIHIHGLGIRVTF